MARTIAGCFGSSTKPCRPRAAPGRPRRAACSVGAMFGRERHAVPCQRSSAPEAHPAPSRSWQLPQAFGAPVDAVRSGRGTLKPWSRRGSLTM